MKVRLVHSELREVATSYDGRRDPITSPAAVRDAIAPLIEAEPVEVFGVLLLDGQHQPTAWHEVSRGTLTASLVHPREVFGAALRLGAAAILVAHNHPSGDPRPSHQDREVTARLVAAGKLLGVPVLDHVIIGSGGNYSTARRDGWGDF